MYFFSSLPSALLLALALHSGVNAASDDNAKVVEPCTVTSPNGAFYDLRQLTITLRKDGKKPGKHEKVDDWHARGYDYHSNTNFTLNICAPLVEEKEHFVGIAMHSWTNVSAYYELGDKMYSIG
jgi:cation-dependent mannose-6-phosphate receptor